MRHGLHLGGVADCAIRACPDLLSLVLFKVTVKVSIAIESPSCTHIDIITVIFMESPKSHLRFVKQSLPHFHKDLRIS